MSGLKILFNRWFSHKIMLIFSLVFFVGMLTAVMLLHAEPGVNDDYEDNYLMCKVCGLFPMIFGALISTIFVSAAVTGNRFMRSIPAAKCLYTKSVPVFGTILSFGWGIATNIVYAAFILISGRDICNISDMLLMSAVIGIICTIWSTLMLSSRTGVILGILCYLPCLLVMGAVHALPEKITYEGFGLPVWAAALIFCGALLLGAAAAAVIAGISYYKVNFKEQSYGQVELSYGQMCKK